MILAVSVHIQLELLRHSQTWVKSKLKSFQILASVCLSPSRVPAGLDSAAFSCARQAQSITEKYFS